MKKKYIVIADHGIGDLLMSLQPIINIYHQSSSSGFGLVLVVKSKFESELVKKNFLPNYDIDVTYSEKKGFFSRLKQLTSLRKKLKKVFLYIPQLVLRHI